MDKGKKYTNDGVQNSMTFSIVLRQLREEFHHSQKEIAEYLGITRQAVAAYELGKREPDYDTLQRLADYFKVSVDYLLGRAQCRDQNAITLGNNIAMIRGEMLYNEFSVDIGKKTGVLLYPETLELYERGERMPVSGTIKVLSKYAGVRDSFFFQPNTIDSYKREREIYKMEILQEIASEGSEDNKIPSFLDLESLIWMSNERNLPFLRLAMQIQQSGLSVNVLKPIVESFQEKEN